MQSLLAVGGNMNFALKVRIKVLTDLFGYVVRWRPSIVAVTMVGVLSSMVELVAMASLVPLSRLAAYQPVAPNSLWHKVPAALGFQTNVKFFAASFLILLMLRAVSSAIATTLINRIYRNLIGHFSSSSLDGFVHHLSFQQINKESIGHFMTLAGDEANRAAQLVMAVMRLIPSLTLLILYVGLIFYQSLVFGTGLVLFFLFTFVSLLGAFRQMHRLGHRLQEQSRAHNTHFIDSLGGLRTVRGFNAEDFVSKRYGKMMKDYAWTAFAIDSINLLSRVAPALLLTSVLFVACILFLNDDWLARNLPLMFVGSMMVMRLMPLAGQVLEAMLRLTSDLRATSNISEMLRSIRDNRLPARDKLVELGGPVRRIEFDRVGFRYSDDTPLVLNQTSIVFEAGKSYAITGPSGSGKSSLVDLLLKFYEPQSGVIRINGRDISEIAAASVRRHIVLVEQSTRVFYDTVLENVRFGREASAQQVQAALRSVGLIELLATLPNGMDTMVNFQGNNFSGGQRQRIGIARGLLLAADVLIMDESTNALDSGIREAILKNVLERYSDAIVIFISHDPVVLSVVDEVIRIKDLVAQSVVYA